MLIGTHSDDAVLALWRAGLPLKTIVRQTGNSRGTVLRILRGERNDVFHPRGKARSKPIFPGSMNAGRAVIAREHLSSVH